MTFSLLAFGAAATAWIWYLALIPTERVPIRPVTHAALMVGAIGLGVVGFGGGVLSAIFSGLAVLLAGYFLYLLTVAELPPGELVVSVGDPLPVFSAVSDSGLPVGSEIWSGHRLMLKSYRGGW